VITALIAEDEPLLAAGLQAELAPLWPDLRVSASVGFRLQPAKYFFRSAYCTWESPPGVSA